VLENTNKPLANKCHLIAAKSPEIGPEIGPEIK
jgi:hypothetical protein